jgi:hypothetical protein
MAMWRFFVCVPPPPQLICAKPCHLYGHCMPVQKAADRQSSLPSTAGMPRADASSNTESHIAGRIQPRTIAGAQEQRSKAFFLRRTLRSKAAAEDMGVRLVKLASFY